DWALAAFVVGFSSLLAQLVGLREFVAAWAGNELVIGIYLGCAMLLTAAGATWPRRHRRADSRELAWLLVFSALLPAAQILIIRALRGVLSPLATPSIAAVSALAVVALAPVCLPFGWTFARAAERAAAAGSTARAYVAETAGAVLAGVLYTAAAALSVTTFSTALVGLVAGGVTGACLFFGDRRWRDAIAAVTASLLVAGACVVLRPERVVLESWFPGQKVLDELDGPYGNLVLTTTGDQRSLFRDGVPISTEADPRQAEESVHFAMVQRRRPARVLLLGGLAMGADREVLKYPVEVVDDVEIDPALARLAESLRSHRAGAAAGRDGSVEHLPARDTRLTVRIDDPRRFVRRASGRYDVIVVGAADPATAAGSRFFTKEFFEDLSGLLADEGVLSMSAVGAANYRSEAERALLQSVRATLSSVFPHVVALPAGRVVFLASRGPLTVDVARRIEDRGIAVSFVDRAHVSAELSPERVAALERDLSGPGRVNRDQRPAIYRLYLDRWLGQVGGTVLWPAAAFVLLLAVIFRRTVGTGGTAVHTAIATTGLASLTLEVCLLLAFQMASGSLFYELGLLLASFMVGTTVGARWASLRCARPARRLAATDVTMAVAGTSIAAAMSASMPVEGAWGVTAYACALGVLGVLTGMEMPLAVETLSARAQARTGEAGRLLSGLYGVDLAGAALGAVTAAVVLVPAVGVVRTCLAVSAVKALSAAGLMLGARSVRVPAAPDSRGVPVRFVAASLLIAAAFLIAAPQTRLSMYALSFSEGYHAVLLGLLAAGLAATLDVRPAASGLRRSFHRVLGVMRSESVRAFHYAVFSLAAFYPLVRCYFRVPYVFCHVCPRVCVFGYLRPYWVPAAVLMNLGSYSWCRRMCPVGAVFERRPRAGTPQRRVARAAAVVRTGVLVAVGWAYFAVIGSPSTDSPTSGDLYSVVFKNGFTVSAAVLAAVAALWWLSRWVPRSFCQLACPIGASCDLANAALRKVPAGAAAGRDDHGC
ncbi:MAG: hypothetical protein D6760_04055, partial [Deltaproteobacteria bacterium]